MVPVCASSMALNLCRVSRSSSSRGMGHGIAVTIKNFLQSTNSEFTVNKEVISCNWKNTGISHWSAYGNNLKLLPLRLSEFGSKGRGILQ